MKKLKTIVILIAVFCSYTLVSSCAGTKGLCPAYDTYKKPKPNKGMKSGGRQKWMN